MPVGKVTAKVGLPFGIGEIAGEWRPDEAERAAAWEMYVELITRIAVVDLGPDEGLLEEALGSLYALFEITRDILRRHGPTVAQPKGGTVSFGHLAVAILNQALRPLLARWHPVLDDYQHSRPSGTSRLDWERAWPLHDQLRADLTEVRATLRAYAGLLGEVCNAHSLLTVATAH
jgi:hypothetical protein